MVEKTRKLGDREVQKDVHFRKMIVADIDRILEIEQVSFATPWSREAFYNEMVHNQFAYYLLIEREEVIFGYCGIWTIIDEAHITNVAILPEFRGNKYGEMLLEKAMEIAKEQGAKHMTLEVRVSNHIAQSLYKKLGFQSGGIRKNYYSDNLEDALVMWVNLYE